MLECCIALGWKGLSGTNTLAYWAHSQVAKIFTKLHFLRNGPKMLECFISLGWKRLTRAKHSMEQRALKNVNNNLNMNIYSYLDTSGGQNSDTYLNVVHFLNTSVN